MRGDLLAASTDKADACRDDNLAERLQLDAIVAVVDAVHIEQHLADEKPEGVENEVCGH
jgi:G3E family GTPase